MLDTLKVMVGTDALKEMVGELFTTFIDNVEPQLKEALSKQLIQFNAGDNLPTFFGATGAGVTMPMADVDLFGKFSFLERLSNLLRRVFTVIFKDCAISVNSLLFKTYS
mgnify:CR=1 FL=1